MKKQAFECFHLSGEIFTPLHQKKDSCGLIDPDSAYFKRLLQVRGTSYLMYFCILVSSWDLDFVIVMYICSLLCVPPPHCSCGYAILHKCASKKLSSHLSRLNDSNNGELSFVYINTRKQMSSAYKQPHTIHIRSSCET